MLLASKLTFVSWAVCGVPRLITSTFTFLVPPPNIFFACALFMMRPGAEGAKSSIPLSPTGYTWPGKTEPPPALPRPIAVVGAVAPELGVVLAPNIPIKEFRINCLMIILTISRMMELAKSLKFALPVMTISVSWSALPSAQLAVACCISSVISFHSFINFSSGVPNCST